MKRDTVAAVAIGVAILVMAVAIVVAVAGPARATEDPNLGPAELKCQQALASLENRSWQGLIEQLTVPGEERSSISLQISPAPQGQALRAVKREDVSLVHAFRTGGDTVVFENMDGGGRCVVRCHNHKIVRGEMQPEWVVEVVSLAGVGEVKRAPDVIVLRK